VALRLQVVRVEARVLALDVLVREVEVAVELDRARRQQVVRLVAAVARAVERVDVERRRIDGEEQDPDREVTRQALRLPERARSPSA
jgi:hypothetical protein